MGQSLTKRGILRMRRKTVFKIDDKDIRRLEGDLKAFAERALPFATKNTLNQAAFMAQREAREGVRKTMTMRNQFTERSIQVDQARTLNIRQQAAIVGFIADYMEVQEFGGFETQSERPQGATYGFPNAHPVR